MRQVAMLLIGASALAGLAITCGRWRAERQ